MLEIVAVTVAAALGGTGCVNRPGPDEEAQPAAGQDASSAEEPESIADAIKASGEGKATAQEGRPGSQEFGLTTRELRDKIEAVEALVAKCMREEGFEYVAVDYNTIKKGMSADKNIPGMSEEEFIQNYGFGVSTFFSGRAPQLVEGYSPQRVGLGEQNVRIFQNLSRADQIAYNHALLGDNTDATFAVALETENLSPCGGCTGKAIAQVFEPEQLKDTYYNPLDAMINKDPRMKEALREYAAKMREAGFDYSHPDEVEPDIRQRLLAITEGGKIPVEKLPRESQIALKKLRMYERRVAAVNFKLQEEIFDPVEQEIERELFAREVK